MTYSHTHINIQIMATEVYGNFLDVFDEFANPVDISVESEVTYEQKTNFQPKGIQNIYIISRLTLDLSFALID